MNAAAKQDDNPVVIYGPDNQPLVRQIPRAKMISGGYGNAPYDAANINDPHMEAWNPAIYSPDGELNIYRDRIVARVRDVVRNDGWASGTTTRILDSAIGAKFRPVSKPDFRALAAYTGNSAFDHKWADEFGRALDAYYRTWANDLNKYCDAQRNQTIPQMMRLGFRHKMVDGDALAQILNLEDRVGFGRARYSTAVNMVDPDRLSNPQQIFDTNVMRGGVRLDAEGLAAIGYYIRRAHQGDWWSGADSVRWDLIPRETSWGRPIMIHDYDHDRAGQHRGGAGIFAPVLQRLKMLIKYDGTELDAAIVNAIFGAYIESPFDQQLVEEAMGETLPAYQNMRKDFHNEKRIMAGNVRMPIMFPGEKISTVNAARPTSNFKDFENAMLRNFASGAGVSAQQVSQDWADVNYSSARAALLEAWKTMTRRRDDYATGFSSRIRIAWIEECFDVDELPLPAGAPEFIEFRAAYAACKWIGPGRGWVDPIAEKEGAVVGIEAGLSTLEYEAGENSGDDWEEIAHQRKREIEKYEELGLPLPSWAGMADLGGASDKTGSHDPKSPNYRSGT